MGAKAVWIQLTSAIYRLPHPYVRPLTLERECIPVAGHSGHSFSYRHGDSGCSGRNIRFDYPSSRALDMLRFLEYFRTPMEHLARFTQPLARRPRLSVPVIPMQMCDSLRLSLHAVCGVMVSCFFGQGVSWGVCESHALSTPWAGVEPQLKGCVSTSRGKSPCHAPAKKGQGPVLVPTSPMSQCGPC